MTLSFLLLAAAVTFADTKTLATQICLDRAGFSPNTIDGSWGANSERALKRYASERGVAWHGTPEEAFDRFFSQEADLFHYETVTAEDINSLVKIPSDAAAKSALGRMGYESIAEMMAERGHMSVRGLERLNPRLDFSKIKVGDRVKIPTFPPAEEELSVWPKNRRGAPVRPEAATIRISLSRFEITVYDAKGKILSAFPCSIAKDKTKRPQTGELKITTAIARPNYTYTPDHTPEGKPIKRHIWPEGPNCPVGIVWLGLNLPGYGIHGTPVPETIGRAESHGCFRLANWNAARLYGLCKPGTRVIISD